MVSSETMYHDPSDLIAAVRKACGHGLDVTDAEHRRTIQRGCCILNSWGYWPRYRYSKFVMGPYSPELAEDMYRTRDMGMSTSMPPEAVERLSAIFGKGEGYTEAYATLVLVRYVNPSRDRETVTGKAISIRPKLEKEIVEAGTEIFS